MRFACVSGDGAGGLGRGWGTPGRMSVFGVRAAE